MTTEQQIVNVVDNDEGVRDSLSMLLKSVDLPHRLYHSAIDFLIDLPPSPRGCLILDIRMPGMSGLELQLELRKREVTLPIIFITGHGDIGMAVEAMRHGALDFISKPYHEQDLLDRIHQALAFEAEKSQALYDRSELLARLHTLSDRERQVFECVASGKANKVIAYDLDISERTVEVHRSQAMKKMGARTLAELVRMQLEADRPLHKPIL